MPALHSCATACVGRVGAAVCAPTSGILRAFASRRLAMHASMAMLTAGASCGTACGSICKAICRCSLLLIDRKPKPLTLTLCLILTLIITLTDTLQVQSKWRAAGTTRWRCAGMMRRRRTPRTGGGRTRASCNPTLIYTPMMGAGCVRRVSHAGGVPARRGEGGHRGPAAGVQGQAARLAQPRHPHLRRRVREVPGCLSLVGDACQCAENLLPGC